MKWNRKRLFFLVIGFLLFCSDNLWSQQSKMLAQKGVQSASSEVLNQIDNRGERQGLWYIDQKEIRGQEGYISFGEFLNDKKQGLWYRMDHLGRLISIRTFSDGALNGTAQYYQNGNLVCIGNFRGLNPKYKIDSIWVVNPVTGYDTMVMIPSEKGTVKHGLWRYYNPVSGQLIAEEKYQVDVLLYRKEFKEQPVTDSLYYKQLPKHRPIDKSKVYHKVPERAKRKIGY